MTRSTALADGLATALLAGEWDRPSMLLRCREALGSGRGRPPAWLTSTLEDTLAQYPYAPRDRPRELAGFLADTDGFAKAAARRTPPRIVSWTPVPTDVMVRPWPVEVLPDRAALARLLDVDQGELDWFADVRGLERSVAEPLRHYRRDAQRALLHNCANHGWRSQARGRADLPAHVLGRIAWLQSLDPVLGRRLRAAYDAIDRP